MEELCNASVEEVIQALLEYLVDPFLPPRPNLAETPALPHQHLIAKQVHAVVLLYNYYHRKSQPHLPFLAFDSFCKLVVVLKPSLITYMKLMCRPDYAELDDVENYISVTEKAIMDACEISSALDASKDNPSIEGWPISKVAVLLIEESALQKCLLLRNTATQGVWSLIEKDIDASTGLNGKMEGKCQNKRSRNLNRYHIDDPSIDSSGYQKLALLAVEEGTGINQNDMIVLESDVVYSLSKEMTAVQFYIMKCSRSNDEDFQIPFKDLVESLQGPLIKRTSSSWMSTSVVEYFHLLPYAATMSDWISRVVISKCSSTLTAEPGDGLVKNLHEIDSAKLHSVGLKDCNIVNENKICAAASPIDFKVEQDHTGVVLSPSKPQHPDKLLPPKESVLYETALKCLMNRRDYLSCQRRNLEDELSLCDKSIDIILEGCEGSLDVKIDVLVQGCNEACLNAADGETNDQQNKSQGLSQYLKRKRQDEAALTLQNSCEKLDEVCRRNNWIPPNYHVNVSSGSYKATVTTKGEDFEMSFEGEACSSAFEARASAAANIISKLKLMDCLSL